ncbi:efflux transporter outer membrane subunit [Candidatus Pantoea deserta]|uniref:Efflux transporter outer membrane subunit n=1 Tax=Candidatus Pantoea deserta TaxID=1869313 RepID=A0A3N4NN35_9GAMM|nr:efflux transporter outer membrane subunit [Pantoea deserta]RPD95907.1 efflux transporter outer membrane subunit [Pantoea deserta]
MTNIKSVITLISVCVLSGCNLAPHYQRPALPIKTSWKNGSATGETAAEMQWSKFFTDADMKQLVSLAIANNRDVRVAALNVELAQDKLGISRADLYPSISASLTKTAAHLPGGLYSTATTGPVTYQQYEGNLATASWELDFFGRLRNLNEEAKESYLSTASTQQAVMLGMVADVAQAYVTLSMDKDLQKVATLTALNQQHAVSMIQAQLKAGVANEQDLLQAQTALHTAQADQEKYARQVSEDISTLELLIGCAVPDPIVHRATLNKAWAFPALRSGLESTVLTRRPDIMAAEHTLKSANADIGVARAAFFPSISLTASGGSMSAGLSDLFKGGTAAWTFSPSVNLPIFAGGRNLAQLKESETSKKIAVANYEKAIQKAFKEVSDALDAKQTYNNEAAIRKIDLQTNQRYFSISQLRYQQGMDNYLNVLTAQRSYYSSEQAYLTTYASAIEKNITLYKVLGGGWQ